MSEMISGLWAGRSILVGAMVSLVLGACAGGRTSLFEAEVKPEWKEAELKLPAFPDGTSLIPFEVSAASTASFFIDEKSLSLGADGIVRYILLVRAAGGAENVSYEGIRCETAEKRIYALGRGHEWVPPRSSEWRRIEDNAFNRQHAVLAKDFFCPPGSVLPDRDGIVRQLKASARFR